MTEQDPSTLSSDPSFSRWTLLFIAVCNFNKERERKGKEPIDVSEYNKVGKSIRKEIWILHKVKPEVYMDWVDFCNNPSNRVIFM